jgi:hypothetical protein
LEESGGWMTLVRRRIIRRFLLKLKLNEIRERMEVLKFYKRERGEGKEGLTISVTLRCWICDLTDYLWGVGFSQLG